MRIVSLVPSATETLRAWGVEPAAVTRFCEQPDLPTVGGTKNPDRGAILGLAPDLVVVDDQENRREDAEALVAAGLAVHVLTIRSLADVSPQLAALAGRIGVSGTPPGVEPVALPAASVRLRAFVPIWRRPWMTIAGTTYGSSLLRHAGVLNVFAGAPTTYPEVDLEAAIGKHPDVVLAPSEPYPFGPRHVGELTAVAPVALVDGRDLFWWGVRTAPALHRLAQLCDRLAPI